MVHIPKLDNLERNIKLNYVANICFYIFQYHFTFIVKTVILNNFNNFFYKLFENI